MIKKKQGARAAGKSQTSDGLQESADDLLQFLNDVGVQVDWLSLLFAFRKEENEPPPYPTSYPKSAQLFPSNYSFHYRVVNGGGSQRQLGWWQKWYSPECLYIDYVAARLLSSTMKPGDRFNDSAHMSSEAVREDVPDFNRYRLQKFLEDQADTKHVYAIKLAESGDGVFCTCFYRHEDRPFSDSDEFRLKEILRPTSPLINYSKMWFTESEQRTLKDNPPAGVLCFPALELRDRVGESGGPFAYAELMEWVGVPLLQGLEAGREDVSKAILRLVKTTMDSGAHAEAVAEAVARAFGLSDGLIAELKSKWADGSPTPSQIADDLAGALGGEFLVAWARTGESAEQLSHPTLTGSDGNYKIKSPNETIVPDRPEDLETSQVAETQGKPETAREVRVISPIFLRDNRGAVLEQARDGVWFVVKRHGEKMAVIRGYTADDSSNILSGEEIEKLELVKDLSVDDLKALVDHVRGKVSLLDIIRKLK